MASPLILINLVLKGEPVPFQRARANGAHRYNDPKYADYKKALANVIKGYYANLRADVIQVKEPGRREYIKQNRFGLILLVYQVKDKGDRDNYTKTVQDALQDSGVIGDDVQIDWGFEAKFVDADAPRIEMILIRSPQHWSKMIKIIVNYIKATVRTCDDLFNY